MATVNKLIGAGVVFGIGYLGIRTYNFVNSPTSVIKYTCVPCKLLKFVNDDQCIWVRKTVCSPVEYSGSQEVEYEILTKTPISVNDPVPSYTGAAVTKTVSSYSDGKIKFANITEGSKSN